MFAKIEGNIVQNVIVATSAKWCCDCLGGVWVETFLGDPLHTYAGIGYLYFPQAANGSGDFLEPLPDDHPSWVANINGKLRWEHPIPQPNDGNVYIWNENMVQWVFPGNENLVVEEVPNVEENLDRKIDSKLVVDENTDENTNENTNVEKQMLSKDKDNLILLQLPIPKKKREIAKGKRKVNFN
jgi:hypothetical protein